MSHTARLTVMSIAVMAGGALPFAANSMSSANFLVALNVTLGGIALVGSAIFWMRDESIYVSQSALDLGLKCCLAFLISNVSAWCALAALWLSNGIRFS